MSLYSGSISFTYRQVFLSAICSLSASLFFKMQVLFVIHTLYKLYRDNAHACNCIDAACASVQPDRSFPCPHEKSVESAKLISIRNT